MGGRPPGPYTAVGDLPEGTRPPRRGALAGTVFDIFAQTYEECLKVSPALTPPVVDAMEMWEVAVVLGKAGPPEEPAERPPGDGPPPAPTGAGARRYEAIRRRRAGLPELEEEPDRPQPLDPALATLIPTNAPERLR